MMGVLACNLIVSQRRSVVFKHRAAFLHRDTIGIACRKILSDAGQSPAL